MIIDFLLSVVHFSFLLVGLCPSFLISLSIIEHSESPRLIDTTYPTIMQWYKILARVLLLFSVLDFALAAPVVASVREHEVRVRMVDAAKDGLADAGDWINAPGSFSGHWREHEPRQHDPTDPTDSPGPSNPAPAVDPHAPPPDISPKVLPESSLEKPPSFNSWLPAKSQSGSNSYSWSSGGSGWQSFSSNNPGSPDPDELSTAESRPPSMDQPEIGHPPQAPPSEPELSTKLHPPSIAEFPDYVKDAARILMEGFKPRTYSSAVDAAERE